MTARCAPITYDFRLFLMSLHRVGLNSSSTASSPLHQNFPMFSWELVDGLWATKSEGVGLLSMQFFPRCPAYVITIHQCYRRTERRSTCDRNTALCTIASRGNERRLRKRDKKVNSFHWLHTNKLTITGKVKNYYCQEGLDTSTNMILLWVWPAC